MKNVDEYLSDYLDELTPFKYTKEKLDFVPADTEYKLDKAIKIDEGFYLGLRYLNSIETNRDHVFEFYACQFPSPYKYPLFEEIAENLLDKCVVPYNTFYSDKNTSEYITSVINLHIFYVNNLMKVHHGRN